MRTGKILLLLRSLRRLLRGLLEGWLSAVTGHPVLVLILTFLATAAILGYTIAHFRIDTEFSGMMSDELPYRRLEKEFQEAFPGLSDRIVVAIDAETPEAARLQTERIVKRLRNQKNLYDEVYWPGGDDFFRKNGLLYLSVEELQRLADRLASIQPLLGMISRDFSLRGLFSVIEKVLTAEEDGELRERLAVLLNRLPQALERAAAGQSYQVSWRDLVFGEKEAGETQPQLIILKPVPGMEEPALEAMDRVRRELTDASQGLRVRLTGDVVLECENLEAARNSIGVATFVSFVLVAMALLIGLGSGRLVAASLLTLFVGLLWTLGFAIAFVGRLNLISVAFGVLFIGLGIDYSIQFCLRFREIRTPALGYRESVLKTGRWLGRSLWLCTITTAIGFYSFLPTAYTGVSELGLISGTGMFFNFFATLTVLPALLVLLPVREEKPRKLLKGPLLYLPYKHQRAIRAGALVAAIGSSLLLPGIYFDYNPLNLYDPRSEGVTTLKELSRDVRISPWTTSVLARDAEAAEKIASRLRGLEEVKEAVTIAGLVPENQPEKMDVLSGAALLLQLDRSSLRPVSLKEEEKRRALGNFKEALRNFLSRKEGGESFRAAAGRLLTTIDDFEKRADQEALDKLEENLLSSLSLLFEDLETALQAQRFTQEDFPDQVRRSYVAPDGRYRVEVFPREDLPEDLMDIEALGRFVDAVTAVVPGAIDGPVSIREAGKAVSRSFLQAIFYALAAVSLYLLIELRSLRDTLLVLLPLALSLLLSAATSVILDIPFNFANVIVLPLLLGFGVDTGIYFVYRYRNDPPPSGNMLETSTARAVFFSTLTTLLSFSSLTFSPHRGMASMGGLLTISLGFLTITTLILLPLFLEKRKVRGRTHGGGTNGRHP